MALFGRIIQIDIGKAGAIGKSFSDYHINFDIKKTEYGKEANPCKVIITNLSSDIYSNIFAEKQRLIVKAGFREEHGLEVVFIGDITYIENRIQRPETLTIIDAGDANNTLRDSKLSISYNIGTQGFQILKDIIDSFNLPKKTNLSLINIAKKVYNNGFNFNGATSTAMDKICKYLGLTWSIQNEEMKIYEKYNNDRSLAIELNSDTGLIGSPQRTKISSSESTVDKTKEIDGWAIECLLQPKAEPGGIVVLSNGLNRQKKKFKIVTVHHTGDNMESDFKTILQAVEI
jgi:hypothetical protein